MNEKKDRQMKDQLNQDASQEEITMNNQTVQSVREILAAVKAAQTAVKSGEEKARRAKALLRKAEELEQKIEQYRRQAEEEIATAREALTEAEGLRAVLGEDFIAKAQKVVDRLEQDWADHVREVQAQLESTAAELHALEDDPDLDAFLTITEQERQKKVAERKARCQKFERRLATLRPGARIGEGEEALRALAEEAKAEGFENLAAQADLAADQATHVRRTREAEAAKKLRQAFIRWCNRHAADAHVVLVLSWDERQAVQLRPHPAASGRLYFQVVDAIGTTDAPAKYDDFPSNSRTWKTGKWTEPEGFTSEQVRFLRKLTSGVRGRKANRLNAELAKAAKEAKEESKTKTDKAEGDVEAQAIEPTETVLPGLPAAVVTRLRKVGLTTREAVREVVSDEATFLALPGIGEATLTVVREWLAEPSTQAEPGTKAESGHEAELDASSNEKAVEAQLETREVNPEIVVAGISVGGDMAGTRLNEWSGLAKAALLPALRAGRIGRLDLLVEETHNGNGPEVNILASWDEDSAEVIVPGNGDRSCRIAAMRQLVRELCA